MSWAGDNGDPDNFLHILLSGDSWPPAGFNDAFYKNDAVDELLRRAQRSTDRDERAALYEEAQRIIMSEPPWVPIDHETQLVAMDPAISNFKLHPTGVFRWTNVEIND